MPRGGRDTCAGADRPGGRPCPAARSAALAVLSERCHLRANLRPRRGAGARRRRSRRAPDRQRSPAAGHRRQLPPDRRCSGARRQCRDRRPRLWPHAGAVAAIGGAVAAGLLAGGVLPVLKHMPGHGRASADSHERLPVVKAPREDAGITRFRRLSAAVPAAAGDDRPCRIFRHRPARAGHDFSHNGARSDSRLHRVRGAA